MSSFETNRRLSKLENSNCKIVTALNILNGESSPTIETTTGGIQDTNTLSASGTTTAITPAVGDNIRIVEVIVGAATAVRLDVTLANGDTLQKLILGPGAGGLELENNESPITNITVTELDAIATRVLISYKSKSA